MQQDYHIVVAPDELEYFRKLLGLDLPKITKRDHSIIDRIFGKKPKP
jgi:hypothetical protein